MKHLAWLTIIPGLGLEALAYYQNMPELSLVGLLMLGYGLMAAAAARMPAPRRESSVY